MWWRALHERSAAVDAQHRAHPEHAGLPLTQLRATITAGTFPRVDGVLEALTADMAAAHGFVPAGASIRRTAHRPELPARLQASGSRVRAALLENPLGTAVARGDRAGGRHAGGVAFFDRNG